MVYEFINEKVTHEKGETGSIDAKAIAGQHTLTASDMEPTWRAPEPRKAAKRQKQAQPHKTAKNPA